MCTSCPNTIEPRRTSTANASSTDIPMCSCVFSITITPAYDFQSSVLVCTCTSYVYERHVSANSPCLRLFAEHASTMPINHTCAYYVYVYKCIHDADVLQHVARKRREKLASSQGRPRMTRTMMDSHTSTLITISRLVSFWTIPNGNEINVYNKMAKA